MAKTSDRNLTPRMPRAGDTAHREAARRNRQGAGSAPFEGNGPAFFTVAQLAIRWGISERQVHRFIASGELAATWFGKSVRVSAAEVACFETDHTRVK